MPYIPADITVGDVLQVTVKSFFNEQTILNMFWLRPNEIATPTYVLYMQDVVDELAAAFSGTGIFTDWVAGTCESVLFDSVRIQRVFPARDAYFEAAITLNGLIADQPGQSPNMAMSVSRRSLAGGRRGTGRSQLAGWNPPTITNGVYSGPGQLGALAAMSFQLAPFVTTLGNGGTWSLFNPGAADYLNPIIGLTPQDTVRTMHRRTVRLGI